MNMNASPHDPNVTATYTRKRRKRKRQNEFIPNSKLARPKKRALRPIKNRIRDLQRLLQNVEKLSANIRAERERELDACCYDLAKTKAEMRRQDIIKKYHMVRFFDRQKATRRLKQAHKTLKAAKTPEEHELASKKAHVAEVNLNYSIYYPLERPYSALYPARKAYSGENSALDDTSIAEGKGDRQIWTLVQKAMKSGTLTDLRDSLTFKKDKNRLLPKISKYSGNQDNLANKKANVGSDTSGDGASSESDDGFFEA